MLVETRQSVVFTENNINIELTGVFESRVEKGISKIRHRTEQEGEIA
jgi:hypothetical protein